MATLEGRLLAKWREALGLTQGELGARITPQPIEYKAISRYETGQSSMSVATLLAAIRGMEKATDFAFGSTDEQRLVTYFQGPDVDDALQTAERALSKAGRELRAWRRAKPR